MLSRRTSDLNVSAAVLRSMTQSVGILQDRAAHFGAWAIETRKRADILRQTIK
jgi:hypothetical protein